MKKNTLACARGTALAAFTLLLGPAPRARAVEVSLEENKAARGNIGYVDLQLVFRRFPETEKAKQNFSIIVRQAEEQISLRKSDIFGLKLELERLRKEREFLAKNPIPSPLPPAPPPPPLPGLDQRPSTPEAAASTPSVPGSTAMAAGSTDSVAGSTAAAAGAALSTGTAETAASPPGPPAPAPLTINLPGMGPPEPGSIAPPSAQTAAALADLDKRITDTTRLLNEKQADFEKYQAQVEKNLLDLEGRRTEILLGQIYKAVQEIAQAEGVSVVVDKSQILFGQRGVDLTDRVLKRLKEL